MNNNIVQYNVVIYYIQIHNIHIYYYIYYIKLNYKYHILIQWFLAGAPQFCGCCFINSGYS